MTEPALNLQVMKMQSFGGTHQGRVRPINEDRFLCRPDLGVFAVADGMGGHAHGDIASSVIVQAIAEDAQLSASASRPLAFSESMTRANDQIKEVSANNDNIVIGSTVAGLVITPKRFHILWAGDSRVYMIRKGSIRQLTTDHTEAQVLLRNGSITAEQAAEWPRKNVIVHAIGVNDTVHLEAQQGELRSGDKFVLCSDGLTNHVTEIEIGHIVNAAMPERACVELIRLALDRGGTDNVTVVVVHCE